MARSPQSPPCLEADRCRHLPLFHRAALFSVALMLTRRGGGCLRRRIPRDRLPGALLATRCVAHGSAARLTAGSFTQITDRSRTVVWIEPDIAAEVT